jgi:transposase
MNLTSPLNVNRDVSPQKEGVIVQPFGATLCIREPSFPLSPQHAHLERVDDIPLLMALQQRIDLAGIIDAVLPRHWSHQGLSIGQLVVGWNTFILSEGDHRKVSVRDWVTNHQVMIQQLLGEPIRDTDFTDDRLGQVLTHLSHDSVWQHIELSLWQNSVGVYQIQPDCVRLDATRINGYHRVTGESLMQYGYTPNTPTPQVKLMAASIDVGSNGHLVATDVVSGEKADDPLYLPVKEKVRQSFRQSGLLYIGDSKMSALAIRAFIAAGEDFYLVPLANVGEVPHLLDQYVEAIVSGQQEATLIFDSTPTTNQRLIAAGYQTTRSQSVTFPSGQRYTWAERLLVIRSLSEADQQMADLKKRLKNATEALWELTPHPGRGRRQIRSEDQLKTEAAAILSRFQVEDYLQYTFARFEHTTTQYVGRGRGGKNRQQRTITVVRYQMTEVKENAPAITAAFCRMGWRLYATNTTDERLPIESAIVLSRRAPRIERHFHLFKDAPVGISPLYVRRDDQIKGLIRLLSLCVRLLTLIEIVVRQHLAQGGETVEGLYEGNPNQQTDMPTAKRLLRAFRHIDRVDLRVAGQRIYYMTPLSPVQRHILSLLGLSEALYSIPMQNSG